MVQPYPPIPIAAEKRFGFASFCCASHPAMSVIVLGDFFGHSVFKTQLVFVG
jgi:hypothetical protein